MIAGVQIRLARAALRLSVADLADMAGIGVQTVVRLESTEGLPGGRTSTLDKVERALKAAGIEFVGTPDEGPGIRYWRR